MRAPVGYVDDGETLVEAHDDPNKALVHAPAHLALAFHMRELMLFSSVRHICADTAECPGGENKVLCICCVCLAFR